jgi:hypothetical protein
MTRVTGCACWLLASVVVGLGWPQAASCQGTNPERIVDVHGFGGWAAGKTNNDNIYPDSPLQVAAKDLQLDNIYFTLNLLAHPADRVTIHAQPTWQSSLSGREIRLDLAYAEVTVVKDLLLRAGKIRNPLGLYTEIYKVGTLRPFYLLPNVYYRFAPESYLGVGLNRVQPLGSDWELEVDALAGQMDFEPVDSDLIVGVNPETMQPIFASVPVTTRGRDVFGGGLLLRMPVKGLELGVSAYSMKLYGSVAGGEMQRLKDANGDTPRENAFAGSVEYLTDKVSLRSEAIFTHGIGKNQAAYLEAAYKITSHWQIAGTYQYLNLKEPPPDLPSLASLQKGTSWGAALNFWLNPQLVFKLDYYYVIDNREARPADAVNLALAGQLEKKTNVFIGGVNFSF